MTDVQPGPPAAKKAPPTQSITGLILCAVAGVLFLALASLDEGLSFFLFFALLCLLGAAVFGSRVVTTKTCPAGRSGVPRAASMCARCQTALT